MRNKGISEIVLLVMLIGGVVVAMNAPKMFSFGGGAATNPAKKEASQTDYYRKVPHAFYGEDGELIVEDEIIKEKTTMRSKQGKSVKALTFAQRLAKNLATLSTLVIVVGIALAVFAPALLISFFARAKARWKNAFKETYSGVEKSGAIERDAQLKAALQDKQQNATKKIIDDLQRGS